MFSLTSAALLFCCPIGFQPIKNVCNDRRRFKSQDEFLQTIHSPVTHMHTLQAMEGKKKPIGSGLRHQSIIISLQKQNDKIYEA